MNYYNDLFWIAKQLRFKTIDYDCECFVFINKPLDKRKQKTDIDNILKTLFDGCEFAGIIENDFLIKSLIVLCGQNVKNGKLTLYFKPLDSNDEYFEFLKKRFLS